MDFKKCYWWLKNILGACFWFLLMNYWFFKIDFLYDFFEKIVFFTKNYCFYLLISFYLIFFLILIIKRTSILKITIGLLLFFLYIIFYPFLKLFNIIYNFIIKLYFYDSVAIKHLLHFILFLPLFTISFSVIITFDNQYILFVTVISLITCLFFYQLYLLYWFNDPNLFIKLRIPEYPDGNSEGIRTLNRKHTDILSIQFLLTLFLINNYTLVYIKLINRKNLI
jgi:hypothetical protein